MSPVTRTRILIVALFIFPIAVMAIFWFFGKSPMDPAVSLPMNPPK